MASFPFELPLICDECGVEILTTGCNCPESAFPELLLDRLEESRRFWRDGFEERN